MTARSFLEWLDLATWSRRDRWLLAVCGALAAAGLALVPGRVGAGPQGPETVVANTADPETSPDLVFGFFNSSPDAVWSVQKIDTSGDDPVVTWDVISRRRVGAGDLEERIATGLTSEPEPQLVSLFTGREILAGYVADATMVAHQRFFFTNRDFVFEQATDGVPSQLRLAVVDAFSDPAQVAAVWTESGSSTGDDGVYFSVLTVPAVFAFDQISQSRPQLLSGTGSDPAVASDGQGRVVVLVVEPAGNGSTVVAHDGISGQPSINVNPLPTSPGAHRSPDVAWQPNQRRWTAAWVNGDDGAVLTRRSVAGRLDAEMHVQNTSSVSSGADPSVAMNARGDHVVVWHGGGEGKRPDGASVSDDAGIWMRRSPARLNGRPIGEAILVNTDASGVQRRPVVGFDQASDVVVLFESLGDLFLRRYTFNEPPTAGADGPFVSSEDAAGPPQGTPSVLANDADIDGDGLRAVLTQAPDRTLLPTFELDIDGVVTYVPAPDAHGTTTFEYVAEEEQGGLRSAPVEVEIQITSVPDRPVATPDDYETREDVTIDTASDGFPGVLENDRDGDGDALDVEVTKLPQHGNFTQTPDAPDGDFVYVPDPGFCGSDAFVYKAFSDGGPGATTSTTARSAQDESDPVLVTIDVVCAIRPPVPVDDSYRTDPGVLLEVDAVRGVLRNDVASNNAPLTAELVQPASSGRVELRGDGAFTYVPAAGFSGLDRFTYRVDDGRARSASTGTVTLLVGVAGDAPVPNADAYVVARGGTLEIGAPGLLANDTDPLRGRLVAEVVPDASGHRVEVFADGGFRYSPVPDFQGVDTFNYRVSNASAETVETVTVLVGNTGIDVLSTPDRYLVDRDTVLAVSAPGVLSNDLDPEGGPLDLTLVSQPERGALELLPDGSFFYSPDPGFVGIDGFSYQVEDRSGHRAGADVALLVRDVAEEERSTTPTTALGPAAAPPPEVVEIAPPAARPATPPAPVVVQGPAPGTGGAVPPPPEPELAVEGTEEVSATDRLPMLLALLAMLGILFVGIGRFLRRPPAPRHLDVPIDP